MTHSFDEYVFYPTSGWKLCCENAACVEQAAFRIILPQKRNAFLL